eukprot:8406069-Alexandrium_andersonii.AAC.1
MDLALLSPSGEVQFSQLQLAFMTFHKEHPEVNRANLDTMDVSGKLATATRTMLSHCRRAKRQSVKYQQALGC